MTRRQRLAVPFVALFIAFIAGMAVMWLLMRYGPPEPAAHIMRPGTGTDEPRKLSGVGAAQSTPPAPDSVPVATTGTGASIPHAPLRVPIDGANPATWKGEFYETRDGTRPHEAVDILAPRNTPIHAVADGTIAKLFDSKAGGHTIYEFDGDGRLCYYYAHLERYAEGLHAGQQIRQGDVIGYVGTSGNAPPNTPHLHFAVFELNADRHWWEGRAIDPYDVFEGRR